MSSLHLNITISFFYLHFYIEKIIFHQFCLNEESNLFFFFLQSSSPCVGRGSTNTVVEWYNLFVPKTRAYIQEPGFEPIIGLLSEKSANATLVQCLIERWWDTTHTFHIAKREITVTPYNFYLMTSLSFEGNIINLDGVSGIQMGLNMLGRKYSTETIHYFDLVSNYMFLP